MNHDRRPPTADRVCHSEERGWRRRISVSVATTRFFTSFRMTAVGGLVSAVAAGGLIRAWNLGAQSLWLDELYNVLVSRRDLAGVIQGAIAGDTHPPLYHLLLHIALQFGSDETAARALSLLFSVATIPFLYRLAQELFDTRVARVAALLLALNPFHVLFAQEARMYAQFAFFTLAAQYFFLRVWKENTLRFWLLTFGFWLLSFYTHSLAFLNLLAVDVFLILSWGRSAVETASTKPPSPPPTPLRYGGYSAGAILEQSAVETASTKTPSPPPTPLRYGDNSAWATYEPTQVGFVPLLPRHLPLRAVQGFQSPLLLHLTLALTLLPWLPAWLQQTARVQSGFWSAAPSPLALFTTPYLFLFSNTVPVPLVPIALFVGLALLAFALLASVRSSLISRSSLLFPSLTFLFPLSSLIFFSFFRPLFVERTLLPASFGLYLLLAWAIVHAPPRKLVLSFAAILVALQLISITNYQLQPAVQKPPFRSAARAVAAQFRAGDVIAHTSDSSALAFIYYAPELPSYFLAGDPDYASQTVRASEGRAAGLDPRALDAILRAGSRVWVVVALDHNEQYQRARVAELGARLRRVRAEAVGEIDILLYEVPR